MRNLAAAACAFVVMLLPAAAAPAAGPLIGTWASTLDWENQDVGLYSVLTFAGNGRVRVHVMNHKGMAYDLFGTYRVDAAGRTVRFVWTDYAPRQICVGGNCTPMRSPSPLGVQHTSRIQFRNANFFVGTTEDGTSANWIRTR